MKVRWFLIGFVGWWLVRGGWMEIVWFLPEPAHELLYQLTGHAVMAHIDPNVHKVRLSWSVPVMKPPSAAEGGNQ